MKFLNIRYATAQRFCKPFPTDEICEGTVSVCPQDEKRVPVFLGTVGESGAYSEDCLRLNVFTPSREGRKPVLVYLHGGSFVSGSGQRVSNDASLLSEEGDMVVVCVSYRVGVFGFLYNPQEGCVNLGLEDQICALGWVQRHIAEFGGNPSDVTLAGQSAGAYSVACLISRGCKGLFHRAIMFSAPLALSASPRHGKKICRNFLKAMENRGNSVTDILDAQRIALQKSWHPVPLCPVGESVMPSDGHAPEWLEDVLLTCHYNDAEPFAGTILKRPMTWIIFQRPMLRFAAALKAKGVHAETAIFRWHPKTKGACARHNMELPFLFGDWECWSNAGMLEGVSREEYEQRGHFLRKAVANFVKYGKSTL